MCFTHARFPCHTDATAGLSTSKFLQAEVIRGWWISLPTRTFFPLISDQRAPVGGCSDTSRANKVNMSKRSSAKGFATNQNNKSPFKCSIPIFIALHLSDNPILFLFSSSTVNGKIKKQSFTFLSFRQVHIGPMPFLYPFETTTTGWHLLHTITARQLASMRHTNIHRFQAYCCDNKFAIGFER